MTKTMFVFCLIFVDLILQPQPSQCFESWDDIFDSGSSESGPTCELIPPEVNLFIEDAVEIYAKCSDMPDVNFLIELCNGDIIIPLNTTVLNETHAVTTLEGSENVKGRNTLSLFGKNKNGDIILEEELASMVFFVLDRLQNVTNVSSVWHYSRAEFDVKWNLGVDYSNHPVYVETKWVANDKRDTGLYNCSSFGDTFCHLDKFYSQSIVFFHISVKVVDSWWNPYLDNQKYFLQPQIHEFPHFIYEAHSKQYVEPERPRNFKIKGSTSRCFNMTWTNDVYFHGFSEDVLFCVTFNNQNGETTKTYNSRLPNDQFEKTVTICNLDPNTFYRVKLQVKPVVGGYWSELAEDMESTLEDRPSHGPLMTNTSFRIDTCDEGKRDVILYWKDLTLNEANGVLTKFLVTFNSEEGLVRHNSNHMKAHLACNETYNVEVFSSTFIGLTHNPSRIVIPAEKDVLKLPFPVDLKVEELKKNDETNLMDVNLTWTNDENWIPSQQIFLVLYFCQGQTFTNDICLNDFQSKVVPLENQFLAIHNISQKTDRFGFALEQDENYFSGITWTDCIYNKNKKPRIVTDVIAQPGKMFRSILVVWNAQRCSKDTMALVLMYRVHYCTQSKLCDVKNVKGGDVSSVLLTDLDVDETYTISVSAKSFSKEGPASLSVTNSPSLRDNDDSGNVTTITVILIIFTLLAVALIIFCVIWNFKKRKEKARKSLSFTKLYPKQHTEDDNLYKKDSGISTITLTSTIEAPNSDTGGIETQDPPYAVINFGNDAYQPTNDMSPEEVENNPVFSVGLAPPTNLPPEPEEDLQAEAVEPDSVEPKLPHLQNIRHNQAFMVTNDSHSKNGVPNSVVDYVIQSDQCLYAYAGFNSENGDDTSIDTLSESSGGENCIDSPSLVQTFGFEIKENICNISSVKKCLDQSSVINNHDKGNKEQCSRSDKKDSALANENCSGESSLSSLNPNSYVKATLENSDTDLLSVKTSGSQSDYVTDTGLEISPKPFTPIPNAGGDDPVATFRVHISDPSQTGRNCNFNEDNNKHVSETSVKTLHSSTGNSDYQSNIGTPYVKYSDGCEEGNSLQVEDNASEMSSFDCSNGYVDQKLLTKPSLCERKISEDEGISSPGVFTEFPNFLENDRTNWAIFSLPVLTLGQSSNTPADNPMVEVDVTALQNCFTSEDGEDNNSCVLEGSRNDINDYTNPSMMEHGNSDYV